MVRSDSMNATTAPAGGPPAYGNPQDAEVGFNPYAQQQPGSLPGSQQPSYINQNANAVPLQYSQQPSPPPQQPRTPSMDEKHTIGGGPSPPPPMQPGGLPQNFYPGEVKAGVPGMAPTPPGPQYPGMPQMNSSNPYFAGANPNQPGGYPMQGQPGQAPFTGQMGQTPSHFGQPGQYPPQGQFPQGQYPQGQYPPQQSSQPSPIIMVNPTITQGAPVVDHNAAICAKQGHVITSRYGACGIITAIFCFPCGIAMLFLDRTEKCERCHLITQKGIMD